MFNRAGRESMKMFVNGIGLPTLFRPSRLTSAQVRRCGKLEISSWEGAAGRRCSDSLERP